MRLETRRWRWDGPWRACTSARVMSDGPSPPVMAWRATSAASTGLARSPASPSSLSGHRQWRRARDSITRMWTSLGSSEHPRAEVPGSPLGRSYARVVLISPCSIAFEFTLFSRLAYIYGEGAVRQASAKRTLRRTPPQQSARAETLMKLLLASLLGCVYHYAETDPVIQRRRRTPGQDYGAAPETLAGTRVDCPRRPPP